MTSRWGTAAAAAIGTFATGLLIVLWLVVVREIKHDETAARDMLATESATMARAVEEHSLRTFRMIDQALLHLRREWESHPENFVETIQDFQASAQDLLFQVGVIGPDGQLLFSNLRRAREGVDLSDREHFKVHKDSDVDRLFVSKPLLGRVSGKWTIQLTRRLINVRDGSFDGVIVMSIDPEFFTRFYYSLGLGEGTAIALHGLDGVVRALDANPKPKEDMKGRTLPPTMPFLQKDAPDGGWFEAPSIFDGTQRMWAYRLLRDYGVAAVVSYDIRRAFAQVEERRHFMLAGAAVMSAAILLSCALLIWVVLRQARVQAEIEHSQRALREQSEELARSNAELEMFAYAASHDLREPLRMVSSFLTLLERRIGGGLDEDARTYLNFARDGAKRMDRLILDLLEFSRVGRRGGGLEPVALDAVLKSATNVLAHATVDAGATVTVQPDLPVVLGEREELVRLFQNLIGNALKYRDPSRPPRVEVSARSDGQTVLVSVADNGIGIAPEHHERIFGLFQRLHGRDEYEGTGIGLALCRKIARHHGGDIQVHSEPGVGSRFILSLPAATLVQRPAPAVELDAQVGS